MIEPVERPQNLSQGVRGTGGRPLPDVLVRRPEPPLGDEANELLAALPRTASSQLDLREAAKLTARLAASPTRAGVEALSWIGWCCREAARKKYPADAGAELEWAIALEEASKGLADSLDRQEKFAQALSEALTKMFAAGHEQGAKDALTKIAEDSSKPISRTVKTVHEDSRGHVTHITEEAFRT